MIAKKKNYDDFEKNFQDDLHRIILITSDAHLETI